MLRSAASPGSVGFGRSGGGVSGLLMTPLPADQLVCAALLRGTLDRRAVQTGKHQGADGALMRSSLHSYSGELFARRTLPRPLLDLGLAKFHVLLRDRIVFL